MTNLALAISIDPEFASLAKELVFMGAQSESADRRSRIRKSPATRIQYLVRSGSGSHRAAGTVEKDRLHHGRHFGEDQNDQRID